MSTATAGPPGWVDQISQWLAADRVRVFTVASAGSLLLCAMCLATPFWFFSYVMAIVWALFAGAFALLAVGTRLAKSRGAADTSDPWDSEAGMTSRPEDILVGFKSFRDHDQRSSW